MDAYVYPSLDLHPLHLYREQAVLQRPEKHNNKNKLTHQNSTVLKNKKQRQNKNTGISKQKTPTRAHVAGLKTK